MKAARVSPLFGGGSAPRVSPLFGGVVKRAPRRAPALALGRDQRAVLAALAASPEPLALRRAALASGLSERVTASSLADLTTAGLAELVPRNDDHRIAYRPTPRGRKAIGP